MKETTGELLITYLKLKEEFKEGARQKADEVNLAYSPSDPVECAYFWIAKGADSEVGENLVLFIKIRSELLRRANKIADQKPISGNDVTGNTPEKWATYVIASGRE